MGGELNLDTAAKLTGCWNALAKRKHPDSDTDYGDDLSPMRRAVAFCRDIKASKQVAAQFPDLVDGLSNLENDDTTDNLRVECDQVDGTMNSAVRAQAMEWLKEGAGTDEEPICRILSNARCLSEGVDVPTLDAVFLGPRKSQVDVIQAVGRVMRRAEGKDFGYIILPVAVPAGMEPEHALDDNKRFQVVWQVLRFCVRTMNALTRRSIRWSSTGRAPRTSSSSRFPLRKRRSRTIHSAALRPMGTRPGL